MKRADIFVNADRLDQVRKNAMLGFYLLVEALRAGYRHICAVIMAARREERARGNRALPGGSNPANDMQIRVNLAQGRRQG
jgi:hypothetical protein